MKKENKILISFLTLAFLTFCFSGCTAMDSSTVTPSGENQHKHVLTTVAAKEAGYAEHGNKKYFACECDKIFSNARGTEETTFPEVTIRSQTGFDKKIYSNNNYDLNYCLYEPKSLDKTEDKVPLILFLHGAGERGSNNEWQLKNAILQVIREGENEDSHWMDSVVIAPQCPSSTGGDTYSDVNDPNKWVETPWTNGSYTQAEVPESKPLKAAAELVKQYAGYDYIDENRVYVVGLSMGGFGTWDILSRYPDLFAAGVPICGGGPIDKIDVLKDIPVYAFHGTDDAAVPYAAGTQAMYNAITEAGGNKIKFYTFRGGSHFIWDNAITFEGNGSACPALETWLFAQHK